MITLTKNKFNHHQKREFCQILAGLLVNGFTLRQSLKFIQQTKVFSNEIIGTVQKGLTNGESLASCLKKIGFTPDQVLQIELAEEHGDLTLTLQGIALQMKLSDHQRDNFIKTGSYPILLLFFLIFILSGMRIFLLPQLLDSQMIDEKSWGIQLIQYAPIGLGIFFLLILGLVLWWQHYLKKMSPIKRNTILCRLPVFGRLYQAYYSAYFALEWGKLFDHGLELLQIIQCLGKNQPNSLMGELASVMQKELQAGKPLDQQLQQHPFLTQEFSQIVRQGEAKGNLGKELLMYSEMMNQYFFKKLEKIAALVQPIVFLGVGLLIIGIYLAMLLPIYGNLEGGF